MKSTPWKTCSKFVFCLKNKAQRPSFSFWQQKIVKILSQSKKTPPCYYMVLTTSPFFTKEIDSILSMKMRVNASPFPTLLGCPLKTLNRTVTFCLSDIVSWDTSHQNRELSSDLFHKEESKLSKKSSKSQFSELSEIFQADDDDQIRVKLPKMDLHSRCNCPF